MNFFKKFYSDVDFEGDEVKVLCPFHTDTHPSASINTNDSLFYCHVCQWGGNEEQFIAKKNNISRKNAAKLLSTFESNPYDWEETYQVDLWSDAEFMKHVRALGLSKNTIEDMKLGLVIYNNKKFLGVPVFYDKVLVDIRRYNLLKHEGLPKMVGNEGVNTGFIIPFDSWNRTETTYVFEGEKDMLMSRELGINGITLTGGAGAKPNEMSKSAFEGVDVVLCYDNDEAGVKGMEGAYLALKDVAKSVRYIKIGEVVKENKEDFYDYIKKYGGDAFEFLSLPTYEFATTITKTKKPTIRIVEALNRNIIRKVLVSDVTVSSEFSDTYALPTVAKFTKMEETGKRGEKMTKGETKTWYLDDKNIEQVLQLIEVDAKEMNIVSNLFKFAGIPKEEENVKIELADYQTIYKSSVVDKTIDGSTIALDIYTYDKLNVGGQYTIEYTIYNHPTKHQKLVAICTEFDEIGSNRDYKVDRTLLDMLKVKGTLDERLDHLYQSAKHHIAKHLDFKIWLMSELVFNSILEINYGDKMSGALDVFMLGDTQVGKSETTTKMTELYSFGKFLSLKTSTTVGLIGGSNKVDGTWCNTIGAIPRQNKRLVVLEEFSGARPDFIKTMTDIRTSKKLRLARASGELEVPCHLRMITISNPLNDESGAPRFLSTFPNGVIPVMELIKSAEDVARYDAFLLIPKVEKRFNPFELTLKGVPISKKAYVHKSEWVTTRLPENVVFDDGVEAYIWEQGEILNEKFECNFPVFGTTTAKKLAKFSIALASLILNTTDDYETIIVTKELVDYIVKFLTTIYSDHSFRLDAYKEEYDSYNEYTKDDIAALEKIYPANTILLEFLAKQSRTTRSNLKTVSGIEGDKFNPIFNQLVTYRFIRINMEIVYPTEKFRKVFPLIHKMTTSSGAKLLDALAEKGK